MNITAIVTRLMTTPMVFIITTLPMLTPTSMETDILEHPVRLLNSVLLLLFCFLSSCEVSKSSPSLTASADTLQLVNKKGVKHFNGVPFSGKLFKQEVKTGDTLFIENYFKGLKHGIFKRFYPNNILYEKRFYNMGEKEGVHLGYWKNGHLAFQYHLEDNVSVSYTHLRAHET